MMRKFLLTLMVVCGLVYSGGCLADGYEFNLNAGGSSVSGGVHYKKELNTGYLRTGVALVYTSDDDIEYKWMDLSFRVGNDTLAPGLTLEVGLDGIFGDVEDDPLSADLGAIAFTGYAGYTFPRRILPIPLELYSRFSYAPEMLSFRDTKSFTSYALGLGIQIVPNATVYVEYNDYEIENEDAPVDWDLEDDVTQLGLRFRF